MADEFDPNPEDLWTERQACEHLDVTLRVLRRLPIPRIKITSRTIRYRADRVRGFRQEAELQGEKELGT